MADATQKMIIPTPKIHGRIIAADAPGRILTHSIAVLWFYEQCEEVLLWDR